MRLYTALGPVDYARYQQQFSHGSGDYTAEKQSSGEKETVKVGERVAELKATGVLVPPPLAKVLHPDSGV